MWINFVLLPIYSYYTFGDMNYFLVNYYLAVDRQKATRMSPTCNIHSWVKNICSQIYSCLQESYNNYTFWAPHCIVAGTFRSHCQWEVWVTKPTNTGWLVNGRIQELQEL